jgi:hypothetical protein
MLLYSLAASKACIKVKSHKVSPDIIFYFRLCKIKSVLSVRTLMLFDLLFLVLCISLLKD